VGIPKTPPTYTCPLSLHDALPIYILQLARQDHVVPTQDHTAPAQAGQLLEVRIVHPGQEQVIRALGRQTMLDNVRLYQSVQLLRSEEHTSELQSRENLVCRLLLEK